MRVAVKARTDQVALASARCGSGRGNRSCPGAGVGSSAGASIASPRWCSPSPGTRGRITVRRFPIGAVVEVFLLVFATLSCGPGRPGRGSEQGESSDAGTASTETSSADQTSAMGTTTGETGETGEPEACSLEDAFTPVTDPCAGGVELQQDEDAGPAGLAECPDGSIHSYGIACCGGDRTYPCTSPEGMCEVDNDCATGSNGVCRSFFPDDFCLCVYGFCTTDADCGDGEACVCTGPEVPFLSTARCMTAQCRTDADCDGRSCGLSFDNCGTYGLFCHTVNDDCQGPADCTANVPYCVFDEPSSRWTCDASPPCE